MERIRDWPETVDGVQRCVKEWDFVYTSMIIKYCGMLIAQTAACKIARFSFPQFLKTEGKIAKPFIKLEDSLDDKHVRFVLRRLWSATVGLSACVSLMCFCRDLSIVRISLTGSASSNSSWPQWRSTPSHL